MEEKITDMGIVLRLISHIENPCSVEVEGEKRDIRDFYLKLAEKQIPKLENPYAKEMLNEAINKYRKD